MKRVALTLFALVALLLVWPNPSSAQVAPAPAPAMVAKPAPMPAPTMAPVSVMAPAPVAAPVAPVAAPVAAMTPDVAPVAAMTPAAAPVVPSEQPTMAAAPAEPKESGWKKSERWIDLIVKILVGLLAIIGAILGVVKGQDWRAKLKTERWQKILGYADQAFPVVESLAKGTDWAGDDKLVELLKRVNDWLKGEGVQELTAEEMVIIKCEAADKAAKLKTDNGAAEDVDAKAITRNG